MTANNKAAIIVSPATNGDNGTINLFVVPKNKPEKPNVSFNRKNPPKNMNQKKNLLTLNHLFNNIH